MWTTWKGGGLLSIEDPAAEPDFFVSVVDSVEYTVPLRVVLRREVSWGGCSSAPRTEDKSPHEAIELDARRLAEVVEGWIFETLDSALMSIGFVGREEKEYYIREMVKRFACIFIEYLCVMK